VQPAEFEEREFEAPLYNQLERGHDLVWSPGQVLEARVGFDHAMWLGVNALWDMHGHSNPLGGINLASLRWPFGLGPPGPDVVPDFGLNLFIQAKRSHWSQRRPKVAKQLGRAGTTWSFAIQGEQQATLELLSSSTSGQALVVYAAPAFHTKRDLWLHTQNGSIVPESSFPSAARLAGHERWYYAGGGAAGVANPDPEPVEEPRLFDQIRTLQSRDPRPEVRELGLGTLAAAALRAGAGRGAAPSFSRALFVDGLQRLNSVIEQYSIATPNADFLRVAHFASSFSLLWLTIGSWPRRVI
jgi:hypothetical protein